MQIECRTTSAASQVMMTLMQAALRAGREFHMDGPNLPDPPVRFSISVDLPPDSVRLLQNIPDASIVSERAN